MRKNLRNEVRKYLTDTYPDSQRDKAYEILRELYGYRTKAPSLYKFRKVDENTLYNLMRDKLFFSNPENYNDPYDSLLYFDEEKFIKALVDQSELEHIKMIKDHVVQNGAFPQGFMITDDEEINGAMLTQFKNDSPEKISESWIKNIEPVNKLFQDTCEALKKGIRESNRVCCLTETVDTVDSMLMWGHYADSHKGIALEYDFKNADFIHFAQGGIYPFLLPVLYAKEKFDATEYAVFWFAHHIAELADANSQVEYPDILLPLVKAYLFKAKSWEYEKEWRFIVMQDPKFKPDETFTLNIKPKAVYLGTNISSINRERILDICNEKQIDVYAMSINEKSKKYALTKTKLNNKN